MMFQDEQPAAMPGADETSTGTGDAGSTDTADEKPTDEQTV